MKNLLAVLALALAPATVPALAASSTLAGGEEQPTMKQLADKIEALATTLGKANGSETGCTATTPCGLWGRLDNLTTKVVDFAGRGHQIAVVETVPRSIQGPGANRMAAHVDYYLVGHSTIPGFPATAVGPTGRFASYSTALPQGTYLFELQQPYFDQLICHGNVSRLQGVDGGTGRGSACPWLSVILSDGSATGASPRKRFEDGFGVYTVTSSTGRLELKHRFPSGVTFTDARPITSYKGAVKITRLK